MKSIIEYFNDKPKQINEFLVTGTIIAGLALAWGHWYGQDYTNGELRKKDHSRSKGGDENSKGFFGKIGSFFAGIAGVAVATKSKLFNKDNQDNPKSVEDERKDEIAEIDHKITMLKKQQELDKLTGAEKEKLQKLEKQKKELSKKPKKSKNSFTPEKAMALVSKNLNDEPDEVKRTQLQKHLDIMRASQYNVDGTPRKDDDAAEWLSNNIADEDMAGLMKACEEQLGDEDFDEALAKKFEEAVDSVTQEDIDKEREAAQKVSKDLGPKLEADAEKRHELEQKIAKAKLAAENKDKIKGLDKAIADAEAAGDEAAINVAKVNRAKYLYETQKAILDSNKELAEFNNTCESGQVLNMVVSDRKTRCENEIKAVQNDIDKLIEQHTKELQDLNVSDEEIKKIIPDDNPKDEKPKGEEKSKGVEELKDKKDEKSDDNPKDEKPKGEEKSKEETNKQQNPAKVWKRRHNETKGGMSKRYYNKDGSASISAKEFHDKMANYKTLMKKKNESFYIPLSEYLIESLL